MASAIGYQKIWEQINQYVKTEQIDLTDSDNDIDSMVKAVTEALSEYEKPVTIPGVGGWYLLK